MITKPAMIQFFNRFIHPASESRSKLSVHLIAQKTPERAAETNANRDCENREGGGTKVKPFIITDVREFKSMMQASPGPQPVKPISDFEESDVKLCERKMQ